MTCVFLCARIAAIKSARTVSVLVGLTCVRHFPSAGAHLRAASVLFFDLLCVLVASLSTRAIAKLQPGRQAQRPLSSVMRVSIASHSMRAFAELPPDQQEQRPFSSTWLMFSLRSRSYHQISKNSARSLRFDMWFLYVRLTTIKSPRTASILFDLLCVDHFPSAGAHSRSPSHTHTRCAASRSARTVSVRVGLACVFSMLA